MKSNYLYALFYDIKPIGIFHMNPTSKFMHIQSNYHRLICMIDYHQ